MKKRKETGLDFIVDKLTNSIENAISGEVFDTLTSKLNSSDSKQIKRLNGTLIGKPNLMTKANKFLR